MSGLVGAGRERWQVLDIVRRAAVYGAGVLMGWFLSTSALAVPVRAAPATSSMSVADWVADFDELLAGLAGGYANFEDTIRVRKVDLASAQLRSKAAIEAAPDDAARRAEFDRFVRSLGDPHLSIDWSGSVTHDDTPCQAALAAASTAPGIAFARLPDFEPLASESGRAFRAGLLRTSATRRIGVVRIALFIARASPSACGGALLEAGVDPKARCDEACGDRVEGAAGRVQNRWLAATIVELEKAGATELVVDVTSNSGGTDWSEVVARMLAGPLESAPIGMLKHPSWTSFVDDRLGMLRQARAEASGKARAEYERAIARLETARVGLDSRCDLGAAWQPAGREQMPNCSPMVEGGIYATGVFRSDAEAPPDVSPELYSPALYAPYQVGLTQLPLSVLIDERTHSSAEQFASLLQDNAKATIVGNVSAGAGCGSYTALGSGFELPRSHARVHAPDCVRHRRDGSSERRGVVPDRWVPWGPSDSQYERAQKAAVALGQADQRLRQR